MPPNPLKVFILKVLLWLPATLAAWFYLSILVTWPLAVLVDWLMQGLYPEAITQVRQQGYHLEVIARAAVLQPGMPPSSARAAELAFELNPLLYGYSLPFFTALVIATPLSRGKLTRWAIGVAVLYLTQAWGVCFDILKTLLLGLGTGVTALLPIHGWGREAVVLGYQFGSLILPPVTPVALWIGLYRNFVAALAPGLEQAGSGGDRDSPAD